MQCVHLWANRLMGIWLGLAVLLQALLLAADVPMSRAQSVQFFAGAICLMLLVSVLWRSRLYLNSHIDMLLIMCASGGFGMVWGMPISCHMSSHMNHMFPITSWWPMCVWMLVLGVAPAIAFSRCLRTARRHGFLLWALLIDSSAMLSGMWVSMLAGIGNGRWPRMAQHFAMLAGMTLGMLLGMWIRSKLFKNVFSPYVRVGTAEALVKTNRLGDRYSHR